MGSYKSKSHLKVNGQNKKQVLKDEYSKRIFGPLCGNDSRCLSWEQVDKILLKYPDMDPDRRDEYLRPLKEAGLVTAERNGLYLTNQALPVIENLRHKHN